MIINPQKSIESQAQKVARSSQIVKALVGRPFTWQRRWVYTNRPLANGVSERCALADVTAPYLIFFFERFEAKHFPLPFVICLLPKSNNNELITELWFLEVTFLIEMGFVDDKCFSGSICGEN